MLVPSAAQLLAKASAPPLLHVAVDENWPPEL
jgi:hypothetical protein